MTTALPGAALAELRHYTAEPRILDRTRVYVQHGELSPYNKPRGFWVSVLGADDWPTWCTSEEFRTDTLTHEHEVTLTPFASILYLDNHDALDAFTAEWGVAETRWGHERISIDWTAVAARYDGIIIAPYQWSQRLNLDWYYGWDCASGCIWNLTAIEGLTPLARTAAAATDLHERAS